MDVYEQLLILIADKLLISGIVAVIAFLSYLILEDFKSSLAKAREQQQAKDALFRQAAAKRADEYKRLWEKTATAKATREKPFSTRERQVFHNDLTRWYYDEGGGMFLSWEASDLFIQARNMVATKNEETVEDLDHIKVKFSKLRTQMKKDIGAYTKDDTNRVLTDPLDFVD